MAWLDESTVTVFVACSSPHCFSLEDVGPRVVSVLVVTIEEAD